MKRGIDISSHNGEIDISKVKKEIDFMILRLGYGRERSQIDKRFYENYEKANSMSIPVGVYLYSYACNKSHAVEEAKLVLEIIKDLKIEYPIFIDMEDADNYKRKNNVEYITCIDICESFCNTIERAGYYVGIYANLDWLNNKINNSRLDKFDKWVAQWDKQCTYNKQYGMWQYSSKGLISGIDGYVDLNYSLRDYQTIIKNAGLNHLDSYKMTYTVKEGDNLTTIAEMFNENWKQIYNLNREIIGNNPNLIKVGQKLIIKE